MSAREPVIKGWLVLAAIGVLAFNIAVGYVLGPPTPGNVFAVDGRARPETQEPTTFPPSPTSTSAAPATAQPEQPAAPVRRQPASTPTTTPAATPSPPSSSSPSSPPAVPIPPRVTTYEAEGALLAGTAVAVAYPGSSGTGVVTGIGVRDAEPGTVTFTDVTVPATGVYLVTVHYVHSGTEGDRTADIAVTGAEAVRVTTVGGSACCRTVQVRMPLTRGSNTVTVTNVTGPAPDIDRIVVPTLAS